MNTKENDKSIIINAVDRSLDILEYLYNANQEVPVTQISKDLGVYKSTVYRTLVTLQNRGYVKQNPDTDRYSLGLNVYVLSMKMKPEAELVEIVTPYLKRLNQRFQETVNLSTMRIDPNGVYGCVIVASESSPLSLNANTNLGDMNECYCSGVGKSLLAFTDNVDISIYEKYPMVPYTKYTITDIDTLQKELLEVRRNKYAVDNEEREIGLYCVGAPILLNGQAIASISLSGPTARMKEGLDEKIQAVKETAMEISEAFNL